MATVRIGDRVLDQDTLRLTPRLDEPAPEFEVNTTHGPKELSDYRAAGWCSSLTRPISRRFARASSSPLPKRMSSSSE